MKDSKYVLAVDDDPGILHVLAQGLGRAGYDVTTTTNGVDAITKVQEREPDLILLDVIMPEMDGIEVCRQIRKFSTAPIIMLTALRNEQDVVRGLDAGADEYVTKPFSIVELIARVNAAVRRSDLMAAPPGSQQSLGDDGQLVIDYNRRMVVRNGERIPLSSTEFRLLSFLASQAGRVVPHQQILEHVWGPEKENQTAYLRTYVGLLRRKIEDDPQHPKVLLSSHGVGYLLQTG